MKNKIKNFLFFLFLVNFPLLAISNDIVVKSFYAGNSKYEAGDYTAAIQEYEGALASGYSSGPLYFNLGNAYFKQGKTGKAILNYERARRLIPRDSDLNTNYDYARQMVKYSAGTSKIFFTINELCLIAALLFLLALLAGLWRRYYLSALLIIFLSLAVFFLIKQAEAVDKEAVVISASSPAYFEPRKDATVHYNLYEGAAVYLVSRDGDWYKVRSADGKSGWVVRQDMEII